MFFKSSFFAQRFAPPARSAGGEKMLLVMYATVLLSAPRSGAERRRKSGGQNFSSIKNLKVSIHKSSRNPPKTLTSFWWISKMSTRFKHLLAIKAGVSPTGKEPDDKTYTAVPLRRYVGPVLFLLLSSGIFFYWSGIVLVNTIWIHEYPNYNQFASSRYTFEWWTVWLLTLNVILIFMLSLAMANNSVEEFTRLHKWFSIILIVVNLYVAIALLFLWIFYCNNPYSGGAACNDYTWCCVYFPSGWCPNTIPCTPAITSGQLSRNHEMTQHFVFAFVFFVLSTFHVSLNGDLKEFKVLS